MIFKKYIFGFFANLTFEKYSKHLKRIVVNLFGQ